MKFYITVVILMITLCLMLGCIKPEADDNESLITDPSDITIQTADWLLSVIPIAPAKDQYQNAVMLNYLNWFNLPSVNDTIVVKINGVSVEMNPILIAGFYMGTVYLSEGQTIRLEFIYNGVSRINTNLTMVYVPNVTFPTTFKYDQDAFLSWSLNGNNQNQFAGATSEVDSTEQESDYSKPLSPSARAYTIPGYSVQNFGPDTVYELGVEELNFKLTNRICLMSYAADTRKYYAKNGELDYHKLSKRLNQLFTTMNQ